MQKINGHNHSTYMKELEEAFGSYLGEERMLSPSTIRRYRRVVRRFVASGGTTSTDKDQITSFLRTSSPPSSPTTWNIRLAALRSFFDYLVQDGRIAHNPALQITTAKITIKEQDPLSFDEVMRLLEAAGQSPRRYQVRNTLIVHVLFQCAFRVSELVSLNVEHIDLGGRLFTGVRRKGGKVISTPFNDLVADHLERYLAERAAPADEPALLISQRQGRLSQRAVQSLISSLGARAGIKRPVTPHLLRHSNVTELVRIGTPLSVVQEICGHSSPSTTRRYLHVSNGQRREAIDALGLAFEGHVAKRWVNGSSGRLEKRS